MANFYIDGTTLSNSTAIFDDQGLTTCAAAGFYSDGIISREQVVANNSCYLLPQQACASCATACDSTISAGGGQGIFYMDIDVGGTSSDTGAIVISFNPQSIPDGIQVLYDSVVYNKLSSNLGLLQSSTPQVPTFVGSQASQGNCNGGTPGDIIGTYSLPVSNYNGAAFQGSGTNETIVITSQQDLLTPNAPGVCVMVIPKPNPSPATMQIKVIGPCGSTGWAIALNCPTPLTQFLGAVNADSTSTDACNQGNRPATSILTQYFHQPVPTNGAVGIPTINDYVFNDQNGVTFPPDGWYLHGTGFTYQLTSGIVTSVVDACKTITVTDCIDGNQWTFNERFGGGYGVGAVLQFNKIIGGVVQSDVSCGTITSFGNGPDTNGIQASAVERACDDSTHCPQV